MKKKIKKTRQLILDDFLDKDTTQTTLDDFGLVFVKPKKKAKKFVQTTLDEYTE